MGHKLTDRLIGVVVTLITALVCFYFGSFASKAQVDAVEAKVKLQENKILKQIKESKKTQNMVCALAIRLLSKEKAIEVCKGEQNG